MTECRVSFSEIDNKPFFERVVSVQIFKAFQSNISVSKLYPAFKYKIFTVNILYLKAGYNFEKEIFD